MTKMTNRAIPHFLIVGAQKSGTTTLYRDLLSHPDIFMPHQKEPETLIHASSDQAAIHAYSKMFSPAKPGQILAEASTAYTKRPTHDGIAERARRLCGPNLKIIYLRRDPIERILSHYRHDFHHDVITCSFSEAIRKDYRLIAYSRYDWQIAPWIAEFGANQIMQLDLDSYSKDRDGCVADILRFVGANPLGIKTIDSEVRANTAHDTKKIRNPMLRSVIYSEFYQQKLKGLFSQQFRDKMRQMILAPPQATNFEIAAEDRNYILSQLAQPAETAHAAVVE